MASTSMQKHKNTKQTILVVVVLWQSQQKI